MIDAWTGPAPSPQQFPHNEPDGIRKLLDKIKGIETELRDVRSHLPGAGISNAMLASPVVVQTIDQIVPINFALTTSWAAICTLPLVVPAGMTSLCFSFISHVIAHNTTATSDSYAAWLYHDAAYMSVIGGVVTVAPGADGIVESVSSYALTGLVPGSTVNLIIQAKSTSANWPAYLGNGGYMKGFALWSR